MKYFIINSTIFDGEYEYFSQHPVSAKDEETAIADQEKENQEWIENDYREQEVSIHKEITKQQFDVVKGLIY